MFFFYKSFYSTISLFYKCSSLWGQTQHTLLGQTHYTLLRKTLCRFSFCPNIIKIPHFDTLRILKIVWYVIFKIRVLNFYILKVFHSEKSQFWFSLSLFTFGLERKQFWKFGIFQNMYFYNFFILNICILNVWFILYKIELHQRRPWLYGRSLASLTYAPSVSTQGFLVLKEP